MTYLQSKPILTPVAPAGQSNWANHSSFLGEGEEDGRSADERLADMLDTNQMIDIIRKLQRGSRAVHITFNSLNK